MFWLVCTTVFLGVSTWCGLPWVSGSASVEAGSLFVLCLYFLFCVVLLAFKRASIGHKERRQQPNLLNSIDLCLYVPHHWRFPL